MPSPVPPVLRSVAGLFLEVYRSRLRVLEAEYEVAPGVVVCRTGGHTPGHSVVRLASDGDRLTFAGDAIFPVGFDHPDWHNRSEEHTSELQSLMSISYAVFCLKQKKKQYPLAQTIQHHNIQQQQTSTHPTY